MSNKYLVYHHPEIFKYTYSKYVDSLDGLDGTVLIYNMTLGTNKENVKYTFDSIGVSQPVDELKDFKTYEIITGTSNNWVMKKKKGKKGKYHIALYYSKDCYLLCDKTLTAEPEQFKPVVYVDKNMMPPIDEKQVFSPNILQLKIETQNQELPIEMQQWDELQKKFFKSLYWKLDS